MTTTEPRCPNQGSPPAAEATRGPGWYGDKGSGIPDAHRPAKGVLRIGRPPQRPRRTNHALDWLTATADALLLVAIALIALGG